MFIYGKIKGEGYPTHPGFSTTVSPILKSTRQFDGLWVGPRRRPIDDPFDEFERYGDKGVDILSYCLERSGPTTSYFTQLYMSH